MVPDERLQSIIDQVAKYFRFKTWNYTKNRVDEEIENYFGIVIPVTINAIGNNGEERKSVFVKIPPIEQTDHIKSLIRQYYEVEVYTYTTLVSIYRNISNMDTERLVPECYYASIKNNNEVLVLEDMRCNGFLRYEENKLFDFEHVVVSLKTLAKFHSLAIIFKESGFELGANILKPYTDSHPIIYYEYIKQSLERHIGVFKESKYGDYFNDLVKNLASHTECSTTKAAYLIYGHGDLWRENVLFKYKNGKPVEACLIDFQKSRTLSPAQDVLLFLMNNVEDTVRREHHQHFLDVYLAELHHNLKGNGINNVYSMDNLKQDMKVVTPYSLAISIMGYSLWLGLEDGDIFKSKEPCKGDNKKNMLLTFKNKIIGMFEDLAQFGYLQL